jgi:hypothetical protein
LSEKDFQKYKAASDVGMMVAIAKTFFFTEFWRELQESSKVRSLRPKNLEMLRRHLKEAVAAMDDNMFFFPPDVAGSEAELRKSINARLADSVSRRNLLKELQRRLDSESPTLFSSLGIEG